MPVEDDGKTLFDFMPGRPQATEVDPLDRLQIEGEDKALESKVLEALKTVRDPEIPVNLVDLGLIYDLVVGADGKVYVEMTLTAPTCPVAGSLPGEVERAVRTVDGVTEVQVNLVWTPPWHQDLMSEEARLELGLL